MPPARGRAPALAILLLAGCTTEATERANVMSVGAARSPVPRGQPAAIAVVADTACGKDPRVDLAAFERSGAGEPVRVVEASVVMTVTRSAVPFLPDPACATLVVPASLSAAFTPQTAGEWTIKGIGKHGPTARATFSVD